MDGFFLRLYEPFVALEVDYVQRTEGYDAVAGYVGGMNEGNTRFREAQPVILNYRSDGSKTMQLHVCATEDGVILKDLPAPTLAGSRLVAAGGEICAVMRFDGYITPQTAQDALASLQRSLAKAGIPLADEEAAGRFRICQYGPVYSFSGRTNELLLQVAL